MTEPMETVLDDIHAMLTKYVSFPNPHSSVACALWVAHTWVVMAFFTTPRLVIESPEPGSGKTRLLEVLALLCRSAKVTLNTSPAALYRRISASEHPPTVLGDEADADFGRNSTPASEDRRAIYNSGYRKGATVDRCEGDGAKMKVVEFKVFAPVALAGLGTLPRTITTRAVVVPMRKRAPGETVAPFRERDALAEATPIVEQLEKWAEECSEKLAAARPDIPQGVVDRPAEVWEPLLAVADSIGGRWPVLAREACKHFVLSVVDDTASVGVRLLAAIRDLYEPLDADGTPLQPATEMHSADIVHDLTVEADSPWRDLWGKALDQRRLAAELRKYGVRAKKIRIGMRAANGYTVEPHNAPDGNSVGLADAWQRYLPPDSRNIRNIRNIAGQLVPDEGRVPDASGTDDLTGTNSEPLTRAVPDVPDVPDPEGTGGPTPASMPRRRNLTVVPPPPSSGGKRTPCPSGCLAPARADSGVCDLCTAKQRANASAQQ